MGASDDDNEAERLISTLHVDWYFDGWYENGEKIENSSTLYDYKINAPTTIEARFYYQDTIPPFPVQNVNVYNRENPFTWDDPDTGTTLSYPPDNSDGNNEIAIYFEVPSERTGPLYGDLSHFEIRRSYWHYLDWVWVFEELPNQTYTYDIVPLVDPIGTPGYPTDGWWDWDTLPESGQTYTLEMLGVFGDWNWESFSLIWEDTGNGNWWQYIFAGEFLDINNNRWSLNETVSYEMGQTVPHSYLIPTDNATLSLIDASGVLSIEIQSINDQNLPYREYTYSIRSVDTNGLFSDYVDSDSIYPTPSDEVPDPLYSALQGIEQIRNDQIQYTWQQITEAWPGVANPVLSSERNFKHFKIEMDSVGTDYIENYVGDYDTGSPESITNKIPTEFIFEPSDGLVYKNWTSRGILAIHPWAFKISVVATAIGGDPDVETDWQEGDATLPIEITPVNDLSAHIEVGGLGDDIEKYFELEAGYAFYSSDFNVYGRNWLTATFDYETLDFAQIQDILTIAQVGDVIRLFDTADYGANDGDYTISIVDPFGYGVLFTEPVLPSDLQIQYVDGIPYTGEFRLLRPFAEAREDSDSIALSSYMDVDGNNYIPVPIRFFINPIASNQVVASGNRRLFIKAFKKGPETSLGAGTFVRQHLGEKHSINFPSLPNGEYQYVENYVINLGSTSLADLVGEDIYIGVYDGNHTNILLEENGGYSETQPFQIQEVYGCMDLNSDNYEEQATFDFNCRYSFNIGVESLLDSEIYDPDWNYRGYIGMTLMEFIENDDGIVDYNVAEDILDIVPLSGYDDGRTEGTVDTNDTETNRQFLLVNISDRLSEFEDYGIAPPQFLRWEIQEYPDANNEPANTVKLEFTDDVFFSNTDGLLHFGPTQDWTTDIELLDFASRGGHVAYLAIRPAPDQNGNIVAGPDNYLDKVIKVYWVESGIDAEIADIIGSLGQHLILESTVDYDENLYGEEDGDGIIQYPRFPIDVEMRGVPFTFGEGEAFEGQSPFGFIGPQHFILMDNTIQSYGHWSSHVDYYENSDDEGGVDYDPDSWWYNANLDLSTRVVQLQLTEAFENEGTTYQPSFEWWQVIEGKEWLVHLGGIWNKDEEANVLGYYYQNMNDEGRTYIMRDDADSDHTLDQLTELTIKVDYESSQIPYWNDNNSTGEFETVYNAYVEEHGHRPKIVIEATYFDTEDGNPACFLKGTMITMTDDRQLPIQDIQVGMEVMSYDDQTNSIAHNKVTKVFHHPSEETESYLVINGNIRVTNEHLMYVNKLWSRADNIKVGDYLYNNELNKVEVISVEKVNESVETYNFEVENTHTYFVENIIVHNAKGGPG